MDWHPETEHHLQEIIKLLLGIPEPDLPEFRQDPYDNGMRISLDRQLKAGRTGNELLLHVLAGMDGKELNNFRERNGKKWRWAHTTRFLKQHEGDTSLHFTYHPYTGRTGDISQDWTLVYNGITPMGHLTVFFTEEERDTSLYDEDTGARWPENEIWACETQEALFHILRAKQRNPEEQEVPLVDCDCDRSWECGCRERTGKVFEQVWQDFLDWEAQEQLRNSSNPEGER